MELSFIKVRVSVNIDVSAISEEMTSYLIIFSSAPEKIL